MSLPLTIHSGYWNTGHCQGIALDTKHEFIYYSFTTMLVKTDLQGNLIGTVTGLLGHLGCIDFCDRDGRVYGSLEYKNDAIGRGILAHLGSDAKLEDAFYMAVFDVSKIDRVGMDATRDGVMKTVYLKEVVDDFSAEVTCGGKTYAHRHGCSGIDGTTFGPMPGSEDKTDYLFVTYGVYSDVERKDNDYQVILCYDTRDWDSLAQPLYQEAMHKSGPEKPLKKLFAYTGNTTYGVQNLEYDAYTNSYLMAVYCGKKPIFMNRPMYAFDAAKAPEKMVLRGVEPETEGEVVSLCGKGMVGWTYPYGSTGLYAFGDGRYYVSYDGHCDKGWYTEVRLCRWDCESPIVLE